MNPQDAMDGFRGLFPAMIGVRLTSIDRLCVVAELYVRPELCTGSGILHGGAIMAFADTLGGVGTGLHLRLGAGTTTIESKTNFLAPARRGTTVIGRCTPLHIGSRTQVWQTSVSDEGGRILAQVTQTQIVLN